MRAMLVDDEPLTLESLENYIQWRELGIDDLETASNGLEGLELARVFKPQIIISDVRMPRMNGIELATKVREFDPEVKIIFLSGYSDKEYLKSAIHLKAVRYVEKPVKLNELTDAIQESISQYVSEQSVRNLTRFYTEQKWLTRLIKEEKTVDELQVEEGPLPRFRFLSGPVLPLAIRLTAKLDRVETRQVESTNRVIQWLSDRYGEHSVTGYGEAYTLLLLIEHTGLQADVLTEQAEHLLEELYETFGTDFEFTIALGPVTDKGIEIGLSCRQAIEISKQQFYKGYGKVLTGTNEGVALEHSPFHEISIVRDFRTVLRTEQEKEALNILNGATIELRRVMDNDTKRVTNLYFLLLIALHEFAVDKGLSATDTNQEERFLWQEIGTLSTLDALYEYVAGNVEAVFSQLKEKSAVGTRVSAIMDYIQTHYMDKSLTTQQIADNTYLTQTYLCALFKKETGKTVNEYVTELRITKAKELLQNRRLKLYEVALAIGITDSNYFSSLFKKSTGLTPSQYRERM
ncbi:HTH-type transcriptional activator RhaR [Paenibacillus auburnensis]|uniref:HTH-type transcriptional activator RhaR n=1 Tax=Paenibacillus auburnensis TaxID=2905649 RepID=A0ABM9CS49_9BACL|nr:response regulator [Paenibacillus auburnensis]CAH1221737.1 HTH-type transcriptional activator RhaR [Paenibacillus auburnensis]